MTSYAAWAMHETLAKSLTITKGIKIDVYDLFIMWYLYEKSLVFTGSKLAGQK